MALTKTSNQVIQLPYKKNLIINGNMNISQRGVTFTGVTGTPKYACDRFAGVNATDATVYCEWQSNGPTVAQAGFKLDKTLAIAATAADATIGASQHARIMYAVEGYDIRGIMGQPVTLSFWAMTNRSGGATSSVSLQNNPATRSYVFDFTLPQHTWTKITHTLTMHDGSDSTWAYDNNVGLYLGWGVACGSTFQTTAGAWQTGNFLGTANQTNLLDSNGNALWITGVQFELGSVATPFESRPFAEELALCQRYYEKSYDYAAYAGTVTEIGRCIGIRGNGSANWSFKYTTKKRTNITPVIYDSGGTGTAGYVRRFSDNNPYASSVNNASDSSFEVNANSSVGVGETYGIHWICNAEL